MKNSENEFECWYIENPHSKQLHKSLTLKMGPQSEQEFIIVLKVPQRKQSHNMASYIDVKLRTQETKEQEELIEKVLRRSHSELGEQELKAKKKSYKLKQVLLVGMLDNPLIQCVKSMDDSNNNCQVIPLAIKKQSGQQKFRIPFKNFSVKADADVDFSFVRIQKRADDEEEKSILDYLEFFCQPSTLKLNGGQQQLLNVLVKVDYAKMG